jgi:predicted small metal-binding protein
MARKIDCECGFTVRGDDDQQLLAAAHEHIQQDHPDMVGQVTDDQLLGMAQDE